MKPKISIVIPVYNEEQIQQTVYEIHKYTKDYNAEYILVDDGSTDKTWEAIESMAEETPFIKGISFSRNFGKEAAILAGLAYAKGDAVITIDADLQHPPEKIPAFVEKWEKGAKIVEGIKHSRGHEKLVHKGFAKLFYRLMSHAVGNDLSDTSDYKLLDREVVDLILQMPEKQMFYRAITSWIGFKTDKIEYDVHERAYGTTKWTTFRLIKYAIKNVTSYTSAPLQIITACSVFFFVLAVIIGLLSLIKYITGRALEGFTTVILLQLIIGSIIMLALGLIGYYIAKLCDEIRNRPRYIVERRTKNEE